jgi:hypothetical protein
VDAVEGEVNDELEIEKEWEDWWNSLPWRV